MSFVKLKFNALTILEYFDGQPSWTNLTSAITRLFNIPLDCVGVAYINRNNEIIILSGEHHLQYYYQSLDQPYKEINFIVQDIRNLSSQSATTTASNWSADSNLSDLSNKSENMFKLFCWIHNESSSPFSVKIGKNKTVDDLKEEIKKMDPLFAGIAYNTLNLWKLFPPIPSSKLDTHIQTPDKITGSKLLDPSDRLSEHFISSCKHVQIVVQPPIRLDSIHEPSKKRRRLDQSKFDSTPDPNLAGLYKLFWGTVNSDCFQEHAAVIPEIQTLSIEDVPPSKFTIITLPDGILFPFDSRSLLVTSVYKEFWKLITDDEKHWQAVQGQVDRPRFTDSSHATIIKGQPGIGKTVFLSYVLVRRLQAKLPTVYCDTIDYVHIFGDNGVTKVQLMSGSRISELDTNSQCCALVNICPWVEQPPSQFFPRTRIGRVVIATSPNPGHVKAFTKEWPSTSYCMPTWNWPELYFASLLWKGTLADRAEQNHSERLRDVFANYRGIPRVCLFLFSQDGMKGYESSVQYAIRNIPSIEELIGSVKGPLPFKDSTSHRLVTIEPTSQSRKKTLTEITSGHIARLLFDKFQVFRASQSIKNLLASSDTRGPGGVLFEQATHVVFCKGIIFEAEGLSTTAPHLKVSIYAKAQRDSYFYNLRDTCAAEGSQDINKSYLNHYMIPVYDESIDSVWLSTECTVLFQMTVFKDHPLKSYGIQTLLKELPANAKKDVRIVFVLPSEDKGTSSFGVQPITSDIEEDEKVAEKIRKYPQYVYRFDYINRLCNL